MATEKEIRIYKIHTEELLVTTTYLGDSQEGLSEEEINDLKDIFGEDIESHIKPENLERMKREGVLSESDDFRSCTILLCEALEAGWYSIEEVDEESKQHIKTIRPLPEMEEDQKEAAPPAATKRKKSASPAGEAPVLNVDTDKIKRLREVEAELDTLVSQNEALDRELQQIEEQLKLLEAQKEDAAEQKSQNSSKIALLTDEASELQKGTEELRTEVLSQIQDLKSQMDKLLNLANLLGAGV